MHHLGVQQQFNTLPARSPPISAHHISISRLFRRSFLPLIHHSKRQPAMASITNSSADVGGGGAVPQQQQQQLQQQEQQLIHQQALLSPRVLSIQSSVVHGYVGNKAAVFPLQLLGFDVDPVYSVQFSNHTGYPVVKGHVFDGGHLQQLLTGLKDNGLICHTHLLTGYIGSLSLLEAVAAVAQELRAVNPTLTYVCDPVLGDEGKMYVSQELLEAYKTSLLPVANILTPNQFEAQLLTGLAVNTQQEAAAAAQVLHAAGPHTVVITSLNPLPHPEYSNPHSSSSPDTQQQQQPSGAAAAIPEQQQQQQDYITLVASTKLPQNPGCPSVFCLHIPKLPGYYTGTGDLLAALLLARIHQSPSNLAAAVEAAVAGLQGVLAATAAAAGPAALAAAAEDRSAAVFQAKELRLVQAQGVLLNPDISIRAQPLDLEPCQQLV